MHILFIKLLNPQTIVVGLLKRNLGACLAFFTLLLCALLFLEAQLVLASRSIQEMIRQYQFILIKKRLSESTLPWVKKYHGLLINVLFTPTLQICTHFLLLGAEEGGLAGLVNAMAGGCMLLLFIAVARELCWIRASIAVPQVAHRYLDNSSGVIFRVLAQTVLVGLFANIDQGRIFTLKESRDNLQVAVYITVISILVADFIHIYHKHAYSDNFQAKAAIGVIVFGLTLTFLQAADRIPRLRLHASHFTLLTVLFPCLLKMVLVLFGSAFN